jgi:cytochrome c oxidase assembly protein subunit 11
MSATVSQSPGRLRTAVLAGAVAVGMVGLAYASVPLYRVFCQVTGFGGTPQIASSAPERSAVVAGSRIKVRFDGNVRGLPWTFAPVENRSTLEIGRQAIAFYRASNSGPDATTGMATFNVSPAAAGKYFVKIQCFCFNEQTLEPGQAVDMPVVYFVDPAILDDPDARDIDEITLSYTFFPVDKPSQAPAIRATGQAQVAARQK